jgi:hypothetical protein
MYRNVYGKYKLPPGSSFLPYHHPSLLQILLIEEDGKFVLNAVIASGCSVCRKQFRPMR